VSIGHVYEHLRSSRHPLTDIDLVWAYSKRSHETYTAGCIDAVVDFTHCRPAQSTVTTQLTDVNVCCKISIPLLIRQSVNRSARFKRQLVCRCITKHASKTRSGLGKIKEFTISVILTDHKIIWYRMNEEIWHLWINDVSDKLFDKLFDPQLV